MTYIFIALTIIFTVLGQLLMKAGMLEVGALPANSSEWFSFLWGAFTNWKVLTGFVAAVPAAVSWMAALSKADISFAYPFMSLPIVLVLILSGYLFGETVSPVRWMGVGIVCIGIIIVARS
jgi:multidrug transporter EmrE-like cation transporter